MIDELIGQAARLMREQAASYGRLDAACAQLNSSLVRGAPESIESLVRAGEGEMLKMRSRLVQIISTLTAFAERRNVPGAQSSPLGAEARAEFESASTELLRAARDFERTRRRGVALSTNGSTFAAAVIENCGVRPTTYRAPYSRRTEAARAWA